jgi:hypothetical protein
MQSMSHVINIIKNRIDCLVLQTNTMNSVMYIIVNKYMKEHNIFMKKANWLKNQDAKPLTYVFPKGDDMAVGLPWRKAYSSMLVPLARITKSGGYHEVSNIFQKKQKSLLAPNGWILVSYFCGITPHFPR